MTKNNNDDNHKNDLLNNTNTQTQTQPKKRGRKPKGGKIIQQDISQEKNISTQVEENIIVHLKCCTKDLEELCSFDNFENNINNTSNNLSYSDNNNNLKSTKFFNIEENSNNIKVNTNNNNNLNNNRTIWIKIRDLNNNYINDDIYNKNSCCFWCTCPFSYQPIYIPKSFINTDTIEVYGHFCTPECASAFLFKEPIDTSSKWERYYILNKMYSKQFNYKKNIKPAPDPRYLLNKFFGTLSIDEYRSLLRDDKLLLVVDKPITRVLPELYEDNNEYEDLNKHFKNNNNTNETIVKKVIHKSRPIKSKIVAEQFYVN